MDIEQYELPKATKDQIQKLLTDAEEQKNRTWSYYEKIRKEDRDKYLKRETQLQMHQDAIDLGDTFLDG
jgi:hypothetical protein